MTLFACTICWKRHVKKQNSLQLMVRRASWFKTSATITTFFNLSNCMILSG